MPHSPENPARFPFSVYTSETGGSQANWTVASFAVLLFVSVGALPCSHGVWVTDCKITAFPESGLQCSPTPAST